MKYCMVLLFIISISPSQEAEYIDSSKVRNPRLAWKLSIIPGVGQIYNEQYFKSIGILTADVYAIHQAYSFHKKGLVGNRNTYIWWIFGLYVLGIIDAYVEAHLSTFPDLDTELKDN